MTNLCISKIQGTTKLIIQLRGTNQRVTIKNENIITKLNPQWRQLDTENQISKF